MKTKLMLLAGLCVAAFTHAQVVDQQQLITDGATSELPFTNYSFGQSFTAGITGNLVRVDIGFTAPRFTAKGTLRICSGPTPPLTNSNAGVLACLTYTFTTNTTGTTMVQFPGFNVPVVAGRVYSFQFIPITAPNPYPSAIGVFRYSRGVKYATFGSWGSDQPPFSCVFRTWVQ